MVVSTLNISDLFLCDIHLSFIAKEEIIIVRGWPMKIAIAIFLRACVDPSAIAYIRAAKIVPKRKKPSRKKVIRDLSTYSPLNSAPKL